MQGLEVAGHYMAQVYGERFRYRYECQVRGLGGTMVRYKAWEVLWSGTMVRYDGQVQGSGTKVRYEGQVRGSGTRVCFELIE